ncbi:transcriptional regulator [Microbacterium sp. MTN4-26]|uniref:helix-turn-helix transcriptional regulator n=1 Tax=unclassified Microbacterium TaxID=2609290 RepID=UPI0036F34677
MDEFARQLGERLRSALATRKKKQSALASELGMSAPRLSKFVNGHQPWTEDLARQIDNSLGGTEFSDALKRMRQRFDLYLATPITGVAEEAIPRAHSAVNVLYEALVENGYSVHWPGRAITSIDQLIAPSIATASNIRNLVNSQALVYVQLEEVVKPSGALVELGIALGRKMRTTVIARSGLHLPFMLSNGFDGVANASPELPDAKIHVFSTTEEALRQIGNTGPAFFGLSELVDGS